MCCESFNDAVDKQHFHCMLRWYFTTDETEDLTTKIEKLTVENAE